MDASEMGNNKTVTFLPAGGMLMRILVMKMASLASCTELPQLIAYILI